MASNSLKRKAADSLTSPPDKSTKTTHNASITSFFGAPKTISSSTTSTSKTSSTNGTTNGGSGDSTVTSISSGAAPKFDKEKWVSTLSAEVKSLLKLEIETLDESYLSVREIRDEVTSKEFLDLKRFLKREVEGERKKVFPPLEEVYSWSRHTPLHSVKVVVLGQDPYHNLNQAHGLCFSVRPPTAPPPSLVNIFKELKNEYPSFNPPPKPNNGLLTPWAERGVLLLNTCLTVRAHEANSHANRGWERFTQKVIDVVAKTRTRGVVFLAWGSPAAKRVAKVDRKRHNVLQSAHPSPLSAHRGFFDNGHFRKTNEWLETRYTIDGVIDWNLSKGDVTPISKAKPVGGKPTGVVEEKKVVDEKTVPNEKEMMTKATRTTTTTATADGDFEDGMDDEDAIDALNEVANEVALKENSGFKDEHDDPAVKVSKTEAVVLPADGEENAANGVTVETTTTAASKEDDETK